jgi:hypothetical protein
MRRDDNMAKPHPTAPLSNSNLAPEDSGNSASPNYNDRHNLPQLPPFDAPTANVDGPKMHVGPRVAPAPSASAEASPSRKFLLVGGQPDNKYAPTDHATADWSKTPWPLQSYPGLPEGTIELLISAHEKYLGSTCPRDESDSFWGERLDPVGQLNLIANSNLPKRARIVNCDVRSVPRPSYVYPCGHRFLCLDCCSKWGRRLKTCFDDLIGRESEILHLVLGVRLVRSSTEGPVDFIPSVGCEAAFNHIMRIMTEGLRAVCRSDRDQIIRGAIGGPEPAVAFLPLRVKPHAHYVVFANGWTTEIETTMKHTIAQKIHDCRPLKRWCSVHGALRVTVDTTPIVAGDHLRAAVGYPRKPVDVVTPYRNAIAACHADADCMRILNREFNDFVGSFDSMFKDLNRIRRLGVCHGSSKHYIGKRRQRPLSKHI